MPTNNPNDVVRAEIVSDRSARRAMPVFVPLAVIGGLIFVVGLWALGARSFRLSADRHDRLKQLTLAIEKWAKESGLDDSIYAQELPQTPRGYVRPKWCFVEFNYASGESRPDPDFGLGKNPDSHYASNAAEVGTVVFIEKQKRQVGTYEMGGKAYAEVYLVSLYDVPDQKVVSQFQMTGTPPAVSRGQQDGIGRLEIPAVYRVLKKLRVR